MVTEEQTSLRERLPDIQAAIEDFFTETKDTHIRDVLREKSGRGDEMVSLPIDDTGDHAVVHLPDGRELTYQIWLEERTGKRFIAGNVPLRILSADLKVNPRNLLKSRILRAADAFTDGETRFQPSIGRILAADDGCYVLSLFDGSHGAAAEAFLDSDEVFCKLYLPDCLSDSEAFIWNNHAHIELRQQEFRAQILAFKRDEALNYKWEDFMKSPLKPKSERAFIEEFVPALEKRTMQSALVDDVIEYVLRSEQEFEDATGQTQVMLLCKLAKYVNLGQQARRGGKQLSFELLRTTLFKDFVFKGVYDFDKALGQYDDDPREREKKNLLHLCNLVANHTLESKWGTGDVHCERFWKKGAVRYWSPVLKDAIALQIGIVGNDLDQIFGFDISDDEWTTAGEMVQRLYDYEAWDNDSVAQVVNANVLEDTDRVLKEWSRMHDIDTLDAYYLTGKQRRN